MAFYQFTLPMGIEDGYALVSQVCNSKGKIKSFIPNESIEIRTKPIGISSGLPFSFFFNEEDGTTNVFVSYHPAAFVMANKTAEGEAVWDVPDRVWTHIIDEFIKFYPDFPLKPGKPTVVAAEACDDGVAQESVSRGKNVSIGGAVLGGALFGTTGAILGGLGGTKQQKTQTRNVFSTTAMFRVLYSNGRLVERTVNKKSREYAELLAKSR